MLSPPGPVTFDSASSTASRSFHYDPLTDPESEIRLLRIFPRVTLNQAPLRGRPRGPSAPAVFPPDSNYFLNQPKSNWTEPDSCNFENGYSDVHCGIFHVTLDQAPPYKALSYTWGSPDDPQYPILLNGRTISVHANLWFALDQFSTHRTPLIIWIDALCINQKDEIERNEQVTKMNAIYGHAEEVFVWLGPSYEDSHLAFTLMQEMHLHRNDIDWIGQRFSQADVKQSVIALANLIKNDYWRRMWILQELVSAKAISLLCGADVINASALDETQSLFRAMGLSESGFTVDYLFNLIPAESDSIHWLLYRGLYDIRDFQKSFESENLTFLHTLLFNWTRNTTDSRDMVYGLAALGNSKSKYQIIVDYSLPVADVYISLAKQDLQHCRTLEILTRARSGANLPGLPSWVPDWSRKDKHLFLYEIAQPEYIFSAAGPSICDISLGDVENILLLKGVVIGKIELVGECPTMMNWTDLENVGPAFLSWWALLGTAGHRGQRRQEQFGRTLICDRLIDSYHPGWVKEEFYGSIVGRFVALMRDNTAPEDMDAELLYAFSWMLKRCREVEESYGYEFDENWTRNINRSWVQSCADFIWDRRFFLGSTDIMGLATEGVESGDIICVPLGCPQPMIFRKSDDHYIVIGEAYVDGYMRGKAVEMLENGELELETFELH